MLCSAKPDRPSNRYTPDFRLSNGVLVETKGRFSARDQVKHLLLWAQHPGLDVRFLFQRASIRLTPRSRTTYGAGATSTASCEPRAPSRRPDTYWAPRRRAFSRDQ